MKELTSDDSFNRFPEIRVRLGEDGVKSLVSGLSAENGICVGTMPRFYYDEEKSEILISMMVNSGTHGNMIANPIDILIPLTLQPKPVETVVEVPVAP